MKILYIAYSCDPFNGSEDQIGWNIPISCAKNGNKVIVVTKQDHKDNIEKFFSSHHISNISYYFVDVPNLYKKVFRGIFYSARIIAWQKRAYKFVKKLLMSEKVDIIHQVAPIEFRAIGNYGKINSVPFVLGPIGGGFNIPPCFKSYVRKHWFSEFCRKVLNALSFTKIKINKKMSLVDYVYFTNQESLDAFRKHGIFIPKNKTELYCDVGVDSSKIQKTEQNISAVRNILVPGRLYYRKGQMFLLDCIKELQSKNLKRDFEVRIVGDGNLKKEIDRCVSKHHFLQKHIKMIGKVPYTQMEHEFAKCNFVVLPTFSEATGTVLIEALASGKPYVTCNHFGAPVLDDGRASWLFDGKTKREAIISFVNCLTEAINDDAALIEKTSCANKSAFDYSWDVKTNHFYKKYRELLLLEGKDII